ncbi:MAG: gamma-glutamyltransferase [Nitrospirota bacterium]
MSVASQQYRQSTGRPVTMGTRAMVSTSHYLASAAGFSMLDRGGSAVDALIAANATLAVVYNHMAGLGGDLFAQVWDPKTSKVEALNGSGRSGERVTIDAYRSKGWDKIHPRGPLAANTVPGAVDAWKQLHQRYGKLEWKELFRPAIQHARGFPISQKFRDYIEQYSDMLQGFETASSILLPGGRAPRAGAILRQPDLASSLSLVAEKGSDVFYRGELAEKIVNGLKQAGGLLTEDDFASHSSDWVEPLRTNYKGYEVTELPPNTQGVATLMILNLIEAMDLQEIGEGTADYYHLMAEAVKLAFADRDRWVTDPATLDIPYDRLLSKEYAAERRRMIDMNRATPEGDIQPGATEPAMAGHGGGDTVYMCAADEDGLCVSLIQSVYFEFGSAFIPPGTGILLQNRGSFFKLDPDHPNALAPRKRTFHTIIPAMALKDGKPALLFGTMGGEGQPQTQTAMLTRMADFGFNVQEAIEAPRWLYGRTWGESSRSLKLEGRIPDGIVTELKRRGHDVQMMEDWSQKMGHAQAIWIDREQGVLHGGADPRGEGLAIGH